MCVVCVCVDVCVCVCVVCVRLCVRARARVCVCVLCAYSTAGDVRCRLPAIIMPGLELQVTLGLTAGDEPPLAVAVPAAGAVPAVDTAVRALLKSLVVLPLI